MSKKNGFGKPIFNLSIDLLLDYNELNADLVHLIAINGVVKSEATQKNLINKIENYGLACSTAKRLFQGPKHVTKKGYLLPGYIEFKKLKENFTLTLNISSNVEALINLDKLIKGEIEEGLLSRVHLHDKKGGPV